MPFNGVNYIIPTPGETGWGSNLDSFFVAIGAGSLQKIGGSFLLANEVDFGASFGLKALYYKSESANIAATGVLRLANNSDAVSWRNFANSGDLPLTVNASNQLCFNGVPIESDALTNSHILVGNVSNIATDVAMSGNINIDNTGATTIQPGVIVNSMVNAAAGITYSKLNLTGGIVNADVNASAAIAYSKLNLALSIVNADIAVSAAIAYSKLNITGSIVNADINASAAIVYSKLSLSNSIVNTDINSAAAIAYSKLALSNSIVNADINSAAAILRSKLASTETTDVTYASNKGIFWTDNTTNTVEITAPTSVTTYTMKWPVAQGASNQYLTNDGAGNLSWTNAAGTGTVNSGTQFQLAYYATSTNVVSGLTLITANRALASDSNGLPVASTTTATELGFVSGVTSAIQTQLNTKAPTANPTFTGVILAPNGTTAAPSYSFTNSTDSGLYLQATGHPSISAANTEVFRFTSTELLPFVQMGAVINGTVGAPFYSWDADLDCGMYRIGSNDIGFATNGIIGLEINSSQAVSIRGTATNNNATAGFVGETVSSAVSGTNYPASGNYGDLTSISLTAGDWLIGGVSSPSTAGSATTTLELGISTTTGNSGTGLSAGDNDVLTLSLPAATAVPLCVASYRLSLSGSSTVYLKYRAVYSGTTPSAAGRISAVRIR